MEVEDPIIAIIQEMSHIPAALKLWRAPVVELFNDNRFFSSSVETAEKWKPIVKALFHSDKAAFPELLCGSYRCSRSIPSLTRSNS